MSAYIYFNLHKKVFSIKYKGKVIAYSNFIHVTAPTFKVLESGRNRVIKEKRKNVHAFVVGAIEKIKKMSTNEFITQITDQIDQWQKVTYNPYQSNHFYLSESHEKIVGADEAYLYVENNKAYIRVKKN